MKKELINQLDKWFHEDKHQKIIDKISSLDEDLDYELTGHLARAYNNLDQYDQAIKLLSKYSEQGQNDALWNFRMAYSYFYKDDYQSALPYLEKCIELGDDGESTLYLYSWCKSEEMADKGSGEIEEITAESVIDYIRILESENYISVVFHIEKEKVLGIAANLLKINKNAYMNGYNWEALLNYYLSKYYPVILENMKTDPEAGMYVAYYEPSKINETKAEKLAGIIMDLIENEEKLYLLLQDDGDKIDWD